MTCNEIWIEGLNLLGVQVPEEILEKVKKDVSDEVAGKVEGGIPGLLKGDVKGTTIDSSSEEIAKTFKPSYGSSECVKLLAKQLIANNKRLIIEDFHYLSEETRQEIAFHLKVLFESNVFVLIIGIWAEQNLLAFYNGDLSGRIEEINISWTKEELHSVLKKGEEALNISFSKEIAEGMVNSSYENIGLLQRIAETICIIEGITERQSEIKIINKLESLETARKKIVLDISQRYTKIKEVFERGFRSNTQLKVYYQIFRFLTEATDYGLIYGIQKTDVLNHIQRFSTKKIRPGDLTSALDKIERLQSSRSITPLLMSYNKSLREISLTDREFLFYRKYGDIEWEWLEDDDIAMNIPFTQIEINRIDKNTAELYHSILGNKTIIKNDEILNRLFKELELNGIKYVISKKILIGFDSIDDIQFYLGFLYKKEHIDYIQIDEDTIEITKK